MGLTHYRGKRNFQTTTEPKGDKGHSSSGRLYVIQKHAASRLHYDLRLEESGVLRSWAVPKGPCLDPGEKRLAVEVEDHPIDYGSFEGTIPKGEYGGGTVLLWDRGTWQPESSNKRKRTDEIKFQLHGEKLQGSWVLVPMKWASEGGKRNWLLIKEKDEFARPLKEFDVLEESPESVLSGAGIDQIAGKVSTRKTRSKQLPGSGKSPHPLPEQKPFPKKFSPQLGTLAKSVPESDDWIHELKHDGYRILAFVQGDKILLITRGGRDWSDKFKPVVEALRRMSPPDCILDGEIVILDEKGRSRFQGLQNHLKDRQKGKLVYYLFDLPYFNRMDLSQTPLIERKSMLEDLLGGSTSTVLRFSDHVTGKGQQFFEAACGMGAEGIMSKRKDSGYIQGRSRTWVKSKCKAGQEFVVIGYTEPSGTRSLFGALLLGFHDVAGNLQYAGRVGTGFDEDDLKKIFGKLSLTERSTSPCHNELSSVERKGVHWVTPTLVVEVEFAEWTTDGRLRQASFKGIRSDKKPEEITREKPVYEEELPVRGSKKRKVNSAPKTGPDADQGDRVAGVRLTHPERVYFPEKKLTKLDLALYYERVHEWILPHIKGRPLSLVRCPQGRSGTCFYQKHLTESLPEALRGIEIAEEAGKKRIYVHVENLKGLISLVQIGALEIHPWGSRKDRLEYPDRMIFDLDPGEGVRWQDVVRSARQLKAMFDEIDWRCFVKISGGKGLHIYVPLTRKANWEEVKNFSRDVAQKLAHDDKIIITTMNKAKRKGKIYLDYLRNSRGATCVAPYSTRSRPGAPVSVPLHWDELTGRMKPDSFSVEKVIQRIDSIEGDPWEDINNVRQSITARTLEKINNL